MLEHCETKKELVGSIIQKPSWMISDIPKTCLLGMEVVKRQCGWVGLAARHMLSISYDGDHWGLESQYLGPLCLCHLRHAPSLLSGSSNHFSVEPGSKDATPDFGVVFQDLAQSTSGKKLTYLLFLLVNDLSKGQDLHLHKNTFLLNHPFHK